MRNSPAFPSGYVRSVAGSDDSYRTVHRRLHFPNLRGHLMSMLGSQPVSLQTCPRQVRLEVSWDALPMRPHSFLPPQHPTGLRSSVPRHSAITRLRHRTIALPPASSRFNTHTARGIEAV